MAMPKANNDHLFLGKARISPSRNFSSKEPMKSMDLTRITQILSLSRLQGPFPAPSQIKKIFSKQNFERLQQLHLSDRVDI